jgi:hypothetical protein
MATLSKESKDYILQLVKENSLKYILAFCQGLGLDTNSYLSPVTYKDGQLCITYRKITTYHTIF